VNSGNEIRYGLDFGPEPGRERKKTARSAPVERAKVEPVSPRIPRIAKLMALAIRFEVLVKAGAVRNFAELARVGRVSRGRMTQILRLLNLAPDIQEQLLFSQSAKGLNERNLRHIVSCIDWDEQRGIFGHVTEPTFQLANCPTQDRSPTIPAKTSAARSGYRPSRERE
jgi:hypothetical protein